MDNRAKIQEVLTLAKKEMRTAENKFNKAVEKVQDKANSTIININNMSIALEIVAEVKIATDELYISYESLVRMIDEGCRPLLSEDTYKSTIKSVADLIKKINNESSNLSSNIGGSFDGLNLGDLRSERYIASLDAKAIEKFWSLKYTTAAETEAEMVENKKKAEKEEKEKRQKEEEKARKREIELQRKKEEENKRKEREAKEERLLEDAYQAREQNLIYKKKISNECIDKVTQFRSALNSQVVKKTNEIQANLKQEEQELKDKIAHYQQELAGMGLFKFSRKKELKQTIDELFIQLEDYESGKKFNKQNIYLQEVSEKAAQDYKGAVENYLHKRFPKSNSTVSDNTVVKSIFECLKHGSKNEKEIIAYVQTSSKQNVVRVLETLVQEGVVEEIHQSERIAYAVADEAWGRQTISNSATTAQKKKIGLKIFDLLSNHEPMTSGEMNDASKELSKLTISEISDVTRSFLKVGVFKRVNRPATVTYELKGDSRSISSYLEKNSKQMLESIAHEYEENPEYAKIACPEPPSVESVFRNIK